MERFGLFCIKYINRDFQSRSDTNLLPPAIAPLCSRKTNQELMSRTNQTFKSTVNAILSYLANMPTGAELGAETALARELETSRTTIRNVLGHLAEMDVIEWDGRKKTLLRAIQPCDYFPHEETTDPAGRAEEAFLEWVLRNDLPPGSPLNESAISRQLNLSIPRIRELLIRFAPLGLIEKNNNNWILRGFTKAFAKEMFDLREMIEMAAIRALVAAEVNSPAMRQMAEMERLHIALLAREDAALVDFPALDSRFHKIICAAAQNRFFDEFAQQISIVVHYHFQWNKRDEVSRNRAAIKEHLVIIQACLSGHNDAAIQALDAHLTTARHTMMASVNWP